MTPWIVTRERGDAEALAQSLRAAGLVARALPCIERTPLPWPAALAPLPRGDADTAATVVLCTSPFAAALVIARWPTLVLAAHGAPLWCAATAPATAQQLEEAGLPVRVRAPGGVVGVARALLEQLGDAARCRVLYPTSDVGEETREHTEAVDLLAPRAELVRGAVYATRPAAGLSAALGDLEPNAALLFYSPSAVDAFASAAAQAGVWWPSLAVCVGASTGRAFARAAGREATVAPRGTPIVDFILSLEEARP